MINKSALLCALLLTSALFSCGSSDSKGDGSGHMYNAALLNNPQSLDPQFACDESSETVISNLYSRLMKLDSSGNPVCSNAESYEISPDGLTYTFRLRSDNCWFFDYNDDDKIDEAECFPVTAHDYVFAFRRILDPEMCSPFADEFSCIKGGSAIINGSAPADSAGVTAADSTTLVIELEYPSADFLTLLASNAASPCNEDFFLSTKGRYGLDDKSVMSNGAFFVRQWFYDPYGSNNILYMKKNSANSYEADEILPSFLSFTIEKNEADIKKLFKDGGIDCITTLNAKAYNKKKYTVDAYRSLTLGIVFNPDSTVFSNENLRKSLAYSIDYNELSQALDSDAEAARGIIPPAVSLLGRSYRELSSDRLMNRFSEEEAKSCYSSAKSELNTESFDSVKLLVCTDTVDSGCLHVITQRWQDILGLYIGIEEVTAAEFDSRIENGEYQLALYPVRGLYNSGVSVLEQFTENPLIKVSGEAEQAINSLRKCPDSSELVELFADAEKKILSQYSFIPVFYKNTYLVAGNANENIGYDAFSGAVDFRYAKNYD